MQKICSLSHNTSFLKQRFRVVKNTHAVIQDTPRSFIKRRVYPASLGNAEFNLKSISIEHT